MVSIFLAFTTSMIHYELIYWIALFSIGFSRRFFLLIPVDPSSFHSFHRNGNREEYNWKRHLTFILSVGWFFFFFLHFPRVLDSFTISIQFSSFENIITNKRLAERAGNLSLDIFFAINLCIHLCASVLFYFILLHYFIFQKVVAQKKTNRSVGSIRCTLSDIPNLGAMTVAICLWRTDAQLMFARFAERARKTSKLAQRNRWRLYPGWMIPSPSCCVIYGQSVVIICCIFRREPNTIAKWRRIVSLSDGPTFVKINVKLLAIRRSVTNLLSGGWQDTGPDDQLIIFPRARVAVATSKWSASPFVWSTSISLI